MSSESLYRDQIEAADAQTGNRLGYRFLYSPASVLGGADVAFIGLNTGGNTIPADHAEFAMQSGSAYALEHWKSSAPGLAPLQQQVLALFDRLGVEPEKVLAGNLVPFRSPNWESLRNKAESLKFGCDLWGDVLRTARPNLVICLTGTVWQALSRILATYGHRSVRLGWGEITGERGEFDGGVLVRLPHLSRFRIVTRDQSQPGLRELFKGYWGGPYGTHIPRPQPGLATPGNPPHKQDEEP